MLLLVEPSVLPNLKNAEKADGYNRRRQTLALSCSMVKLGKVKKSQVVILGISTYLAPPQSEYG